MSAIFFIKKMSSSDKETTLTFHHIETFAVGNKLISLPNVSTVSKDISWSVKYFFISSKKPSY
jgi:hypothetical protein